VKLLRAESGFCNTKVFERLERAGWQYSIGVRMTRTVRAVVDAIDEDAWQRIENYPDDGEAQIAETVYAGRRLIVRRTRLLGAQAELWPDWRPSHTTCCAGCSCSDCPRPPSALSAPYAEDSLQFLADCPVTPAAGRCTSRPADPGTVEPG
jgi:hypothetical protein